MGKSAIQSIYGKIDTIIWRDLPYYPFNRDIEVKMPDIIDPKDVLGLVQKQYADTLTIHTGTDPRCLYVRYNESARNQRLERVKLDVENVMRRMEKAQLDYIDDASKDKFEMLVNFDIKCLDALKKAVAEFGFIVKEGNAQYNNWVITEPEPEEA
jgi:hypothetical protein